MTNLTSLLLCPHACPVCQSDLTRTATVAGIAWECVRCRRGWTPKALGLPSGGDSRRVKGQTRETYQESASERQIQACIVEGLRLMGYVVMVIGSYRADLAGNSEGCGDLLIGRQEWGNHWLMMECKTATGKPRPKQAELIAMGVSHLVRSFEDALRVIEERAEGQT